MLRALDQVPVESTDKTTIYNQQCEDAALISPLWVVLLLAQHHQAHLLPRRTTVVQKDTQNIRNQTLVDS